MRKLSQIWFETQEVLFPFLEKEIEEPLTEKLKQLVATLELIRIDEKIRVPKYWHGRFPRNRHQIARAFIAKAVYNMDTTRSLIDRLKISPALRRICGWEKACDIPHESSFSRAFEEFSASELSQITHESLIKQHMGNTIIGHISRDSTSIDAREKPVKKNIKVPKQKKKRGRPAKGEIRIKELTRLERQQSMGAEEMLEELPRACNVGTKKNSKGYKKPWIGYKLHIDAGDGHIPISCVLTSASVHDSQVALPLAELTSKRVHNLYDLMDSAYDSPIIKQHSQALGHIPIIDINTRGNKKKKHELKAESQRFEFINFKNPINVRYNERSNVERVNGRLKDEFGGKMLRVRGHAKVMTHLMFGIIALTADQLMRFVT
jgi:hypothetical protein